MKILVKNLSNTFNYGSMMMGENLINYLNTLTPNIKVEYYIETDDEINVKRLISATKYKNIFVDNQLKIELITANIRYVRYLEKRVRTKSILKKIVKYYDAVIILGGDDYAETYYKIPRDNNIVKTIFKDIKYLSNLIPVIMVGQTIGPYTGKRLTWAKAGLKKVNIFTRDDISKKFLWEKLDKTSEASRDLAFLDLTLQDEYQTKYKSILKKYKLENNKYITFVGTSLIKHYTESEEDFLKNIQNLIIELSKEYPDYKLVWLTHVLGKEEKDGDNYLLNSLNNNHNNIIKSNFIIIDKPILPAEARIILGHGKFTITCRMHAAVSTFQMGKPAICLSYSVKYKGVIADGLKSEDLVLDSKGNDLWKGNFYEAILAKVKYVITNYDALTKRVSIEVNNNKEMVEKTVNQISKILFKDTGEKNNLNKKTFECTGCFLCEYICPVKAIKIEVDSEGFYQYNIDESKCIECEICIKKCPKLNPSISKDISNKCFAAYSNDDEILYNSSSGGIFSELAIAVLEEGGVVIGAAWVNDKVKHILIDEKKDLVKLRSSKYIQSDLSNIFILIDKALKNEKKVLFSGTPCQIAACKGYFESDNLLTVDVVCHGVANKRILDLSIDQRFNKKNIAVNFRDKRFGWHYSYGLKYYNADDGKEAAFRKINYDSWFRSYLRNIFLKKDCYDCQFCGENRVSDITLGDFWNIKDINEELFANNKDHGVSMVLLNSKKGEEYFNIIKKRVTFSPEEIQMAIKYNPRISNGKYSNEFLKKRNTFFKRLGEGKVKFIDMNPLFYDIKDKINSFLNRVIKRIGLKK